MKEILKPIYELITGQYILFENIAYNYVALFLIGIIAFRSAWKIVGGLYDGDIINGRILGSIIHWSIRLIIFLLVFYSCSFLIWVTKLIIKYRVIVLIAILSIFTLIVCSIFIKNLIIKKKKTK
jgi:hypothetical protein